MNIIHYSCTRAPAEVIKQRCPLSNRRHSDSRDYCTGIGALIICGCTMRLICLGELPRLGDVRFANRALRQGKNHPFPAYNLNTKTYHFLPVDQPRINFFEMKNVMTRQLSHAISFDEFR
jgi:hypothetical protein